MLRFEEGPHHYFWNDARVPNVTSVISDLTSYDFVTPEQLEIARQKGTAVHKMIELWGTGKLGDFNIPDWMKPVHLEWCRFASDTGIEILASERRLYNHQFKYATTLDICCRMRNKKGLGIVEVKRSFAAGIAICLQTAAQAKCWESNEKEPIAWRGAIKINELCSYRLEEHPDPQDWSNFLGCLVHHNLVEKIKNGRRTARSSP